MTLHKTTWTSARIARLCLGSFSSFGSRSLRKLWDAFASPEAAWTAHIPSLIRAGISEKLATNFVSWRREVKPADLIHALERENIRFLCPEDTDYPRSFRTSSDPPETLFVRGDLRDTPCIAIVGARRMSSYGKQCATSLARDLARTGLGLVSGLALGIDGCVHRAALDERGYTIAILGAGVDDASLYPREHFQLAMDILTGGGAVISEYPPGTKSFKQHFPVRNRLIATVSLGTLVIEAAEDSGSLITAKVALDENREVLAVPGPIWSASSKGTNRLLKLGAKPCTEALDVLQALALDRPDLIAHARQTLPLDPNEEHLLALLGDPIHADTFAARAKMLAAQAAGHLALFELKGLVSHLGAQMWVRTNKGTEQKHKNLVPY